MAITFTIPGKPFAKQRPRATMRGIYTPAETVGFERQVGLVANPHFPQPWTGPIRLEIRAVFMTAPSWSKKKTAAHLNTPHMQKPDGDNILKAICDSLNRIAWSDDAQVADKRIVKVWGPEARTVVTIERMS